MHSSGHATSCMARRRAPAATARARRTGARTMRAAARRVRDPPSRRLCPEALPTRATRRGGNAPIVEKTTRAEVERIEWFVGSHRRSAIRETFVLTAPEGRPILALEMARRFDHGGLRETQRVVTGRGGPGSRPARRSRERRALRSTYRLRGVSASPLSAHPGRTRETCRRTCVRAGARNDRARRSREARPRACRDREPSKRGRSTLARDAVNVRNETYLT
jgi:hypothetical protein